VRRSGVRIGEVTSVELDDATGEVRVGIAVNPKYSIKRNDEALINQDFLSRDVTIDIAPKTGDAASPSLSPVPGAPGERKLPAPVPMGKPLEEVKPVGALGVGGSGLMLAMGQAPPKDPPNPIPPPVEVLPPARRSAAVPRATRVRS